MNLNQNISSNLTNDNFRHIYKIYLEKEKKYFVSLQSSNDMEFNLRIYDINKNIIRSKYDKHDENSFIADIKNDIEYSEIIDSCSEDEIDDHLESSNKIYDFKELNNSKLDIFNTDDEVSLFKNINNNIFENSDTSNKLQQIFVDAIDIYNKKLVDKYDKYDNNDNESESQNESSNLDNSSINFNNKQYFSPKENSFYLLSVSSDYENYEGEYTLIVKEVEDITYSNFDKIKINQEMDIFLKKKFDSKNLFIELAKNSFYELYCSSNVKVLINKDSQKIISKFSNTKFTAEFDGKYGIEIISLDDRVNCKFLIKEIFTECNENKLDVIRTKKIILEDDKGKNFELSVKNSKLFLSPNSK